MNSDMKRKLVHKYMDDESIEKYEHMQDKRRESEEKLKSSMVGHLSALNDGVIAIFITVMMLEIPFPESVNEYGNFIWSILVFLVSFFMIADFWYDNKRIFEAMKEADHMVVVANFLFLASLALIPVTTKWIMVQHDRYGAENFGVVYLVTLLCEQFLYYAVVRDRFKNHMNLLFKIIVARVGYLVIANTILMALAWLYPQQVIFLFIVLPIIDFFRPQKNIRKL